jgi:hypothetical protein
MWAGSRSSSLAPIEKLFVMMAVTGVVGLVGTFVWVLAR